MAGIKVNGKAILGDETQDVKAEAAQETVKPKVEKAVEKVEKTEFRVTDKELERQENEQLKAMSTEPTVRVKIPLIDKKDPDIEVGINGVIKILKRGVTQEIPQSIAEVLENAGII